MVEWLVERFVENYLLVSLGLSAVPMVFFLIFYKNPEHPTETYLNLALAGAMIPSGILLVILAFNPGALLQIKNPPGAVFTAVGLMLVFTGVGKIRTIFRANSQTPK